MSDLNETEVKNLLTSLSEDELLKLYYAFLHIDEVGLLGDGNLKKMWEIIKSTVEK